jgi:ubiquinone/menaquinone biosynthesis C-methylase UbiE
LRLFFRLLYNEFAWSYDLVAWAVSLGQWKAWGRTALPHLRGERVLELGHGPGHLLETLANQQLAPMGLDLSPQMTRQAKRRLRQTGLQVPLVRARAQALPFRSGSFDSVVATFPTEYITHLHTLHEVSRVLTSKGRLAVALGVCFEGAGLLSTLLAWLYRVTGQDRAFSDAFTARLRQANLSPSITGEEVDRATVVLIVAEKDRREPHLTRSPS